ncbi:MAG TPA: MBL fold metallo-hydrolase [Candidatus Hydrogenedentes bacterium]|nr:MBL fold metallo-hydrolase [Candidatus Hydrogenedentota bacterium]HOV59463.1 MBL fold metallo-hydrolase [Candidatus Hydrogenedentota bacterium]
MLRFALLASGSKGNATLISDGETHILQDAGISRKRLEERLRLLGVAPENLAAVLVTHEHSDHVRGLPLLARAYDIPVYATGPTARELALQDNHRVVTFSAGDALAFGNIRVQSYSVSHDAIDPVNYTYASVSGAKLGFATDLGHPCKLTLARLAGAHAIIVESNYCPHMLRRGPYPPFLQQRIRGRQGHLSNDDAMALLETLRHDRLRLAVLVHVSEHNNDPALVHENVSRIFAGTSVRVVVAPPEGLTEWFEVLP